MAPPLLARPDSSGKIRKISLGPWLSKVLPFLAKGKVLRGTPLDIFGYTQERRHERSWAREVRQSVLDVAAALGAGNLALAEEMLALPQQVRGFGHVRAAKLDAVQARWNTLRERFSNEGDSARPLAVQVEEQVTSR